MRKANPNFYDRPQSFGWISIAVHWVTAIVVIVLWFVGDSILAQEPDLMDQRRSLHITIALSFYLLLIFRIYWRLRVGHPHAVGQSVFIHRVARFVHYVLLVAVATMLLTGPAMLLAGYIDSPALRDTAFAIHKLTGTIVISLTLLHIAGSLKHLMFHHDETIVRMIKPRRLDNDD